MLWVVKQYISKAHWESTHVSLTCFNTTLIKFQVVVLHIMSQETIVMLVCHLQLNLFAGDEVMQSVSPLGLYISTVIHT